MTCLDIDTWPSHTKFQNSTSLWDFSTRCNIYISRLCYDVTVRLSVCLSVTEVHWRIIANLGQIPIPIYRAFRSRCMRARGKGSSPGRVEGSSRAMLPLLGPLVLSTTTATTATVLQPFIQDYLDELVPEETFTHSHLSWSSTILHQLPSSTAIHSIPVQFAFLTVIEHNLSPGPVWSTSASDLFYDFGAI